MFRKPEIIVNIPPTPAPKQNWANTIIIAAIGLIMTVSGFFIQRSVNNADSNSKEFKMTLQSTHDSVLKTEGELPHLKDSVSDVKSSLSEVKAEQKTLRDRIDFRNQPAMPAAPAHPR
jgi:peptidoglycan hydrolase CwlO-like protein